MCISKDRLTLFSIWSGLYGTLSENKYNEGEARTGAILNLCPDLPNSGQVFFF